MPIKTLITTDRIIKYTGDEILLSASYDDTIKCWAEDGGEWYCAASLDSVHSSTIWSLAYATLPSSSSSSSSMSNNTTNLVVVSVSEDSTIALWKCCSVAERKKLEANNGVVTSRYVHSFLLYCLFI